MPGLEAWFYLIAGAVIGASALFAYACCMASSWADEHTPRPPTLRHVRIIGDTDDRSD